MDVTRRGNPPRFCKTGKSVQTCLREIANKAKEQPKYRFRNLYGMIDKELLILAWRSLNKKAAAGVDRVTAQEYGKNLEPNVEDLIDRLKRNAYRAKLVRRKLIPKGGGKTRPLGIPSLEDRLLQRAVLMILEAIYEPIFLESSYGYRVGKGAHQAAGELHKALQFGSYVTVVEADIKGFFENLDHEWLIKMLEERIEDRKLLRLIRKWLNAGILEMDGKVVNPLTGTPQGGIVSPLLANVYLHYVLDLWVEKVVTPRMSGSVKYVRFADDFVCAFSSVGDAERFYQALPKRLEKFGLAVAPEKTRQVCFDRWKGKENGRFDFLGFEFYWGKSRKRVASVKRRTSRKKHRRALKEVGEWLKRNRSMRQDWLIEKLNTKLAGHYNYYGVIGNYDSLGSFFYQVNRLFFKWLNRRSQRKSLTWLQYAERVRKRLKNPRVMERPLLQRKLFGIQC